MLGLAELKKYEYPVIFDVTHSLQEPGGEGRDLWKKISSFRSC
ncbi:MAG: hypothetical protein Ct9H300mP20_22020 [Gammaproteobacteria bacterium]|nr:MAG: hypothetical protein Ct9H300mP20_22020 [Gammaproteobacteria bacterium]